MVSSNPNAFTRDVTRYLWALLEKLRRPSWSREHRLRRSRSSSRGPALNPRQENLRRAHSGPSDAGSTATELRLYGVLGSLHTSDSRKSPKISADSKPIHSPFSYIAVSYLSYKSSTGYGRKPCRRRCRVNQDEQIWERLAHHFTLRSHLQRGSI